MEITKGLFDNMVLQRHKGEICNTEIEGISNIKGTLFATVKKDGKVLPDFSSKAIGKSDGKTFKAKLSGLTTGGPYDIELIIKSTNREMDRLIVKNVLVGDVWILAGQSNMEGCGLLKDKATPHPSVRAFYMTDKWDIACDPLHVLAMAVDEVHRGGKPPLTKPPESLIGVGPGVDFGKEMYRLSKGVPQGLIACAHGGTSMAQWSPDRKHLGGKSLYGAMLRRFNKTCGKVRGVLWYQGCSDTTDEHSVQNYSKKMIEFVKEVRKDFKDPNLPFVIVQIARVLGRTQEIEKAACWNSIQEQQRKLPEKIKNLVVVPAIDLPLDDVIHISGIGHHRLGKRMANAMYYFVAPRTEKILPPIELEKIYVQKDGRGGTVIKVQYKNVAGKLISRGEPAGFQVIDLQGASYVYRIDLDGDSALCYLFGDRVDGKTLYYGGGFAPYCNITDEQDRSLPVFGPFLLEKAVTNKLKKTSIWKMMKKLYSIKATPYPSEVFVSAPQPSAAKLHKLKYPTDHNKLNFKKRKFVGWFWDLHNDILNCAPNDVLVYYKLFFECQEDMKLILAFAYDGPFKVWVNGKEIFFDPEGVNPAIEDKALVPFSAKNGMKYEVLMALGSNNGKAWGASLRIIRNIDDILLPSFSL